ncbi:helicase-associated domain-containing protein [Treponema sp.]|uniref:helicase-associated domain-containing protein n=1 Tax=Treponema sp. TaxID=166 RepID=UPI003F0B7DD7
MSLDEKVQKIIQWRESFCTLPDTFFFDIVRIYLGEVKTPYNKQKLAEELGAFLRRPEIRSAIIQLLDDCDIQILSAVKFLNEPDVAKLERFFSSMPQNSLYRTIASLEERLLIYPVKNENSGKIELRITPYLEEELSTVLSLGILISPERKSDFPAQQAKISPELIAAFFCYISEHPDICKYSGGLKKKADSELAEIFQENYSREFFELLFRALKNLHLVNENSGDRGFSVDWRRLEQFSSLNFGNQLSYICAACAGSFSRSTVLSNAAVFFETLSALGSGVYTRQKILQTAFLLEDRNSRGRGTSVSRFSRIVAQGSASIVFSSSVNFMEVMLDCAEELGIIDSAFENGREVFSVNPVFAKNEAHGILSIDAGFSVTVMPGFQLCELVPLVKFLSVRHCDTAAKFEITRRSVLRAFDLGMKKEQIVKTLESHFSYGLSQNLLVSIEEWSESYSSASLYKGYVLKLRPENAPLFEKKLSSFIAENLAPGIYLMNFSSDEQARECMEKAGFDFVGNIKSAEKPSAAAGFPAISADRQPAEFSSGISASEEKNGTAASEILGGLEKHLLELSLSSEQKEGLEDRIRRRVVLSADQLRPESVKFELTEASGMNFTGKLRILESAIQDRNLVELEMSTTREILVGLPRAVSKNSALFLACKNPDTGETENYEISIALISKVKKIRNSASLLNLSAMQGG